MNQKGTIFCLTTELTIQTSFSVNNFEQPFYALYYFSLSESNKYINDYLTYLTSQELEHGRKYRFEISKNRFYLGRIATKLLIKKYSDRPVEKIIILKDENNKPFLKSFTNHNSLHFNLSHAEDAIIIAVSNNEVGVDIEQNRQFKYEILMNDVFTKKEISFIKKNHNPNQAFFLLWTRKEAFLKATGIGLTENLTGFEVLDGENIVDINIIKQGETFDIISFFPSADYVASFCKKRQGEAPKISFTKTSLQQIF